MIDKKDNIMKNFLKKHSLTLFILVDLTALIGTFVSAQYLF